MSQGTKLAAYNSSIIVTLATEVSFVIFQHSWIEYQNDYKMLTNRWPEARNWFPSTKDNRYFVLGIIVRYSTYKYYIWRSYYDHIFKIQWTKLLTDSEKGVIIGAFHNQLLTHWGRVTHICVSNLTIFDSNNGLSTLIQRTGLTLTY